MDFTVIPLIVIICYLCGEIFKFIFKEKQEFYRLIPILLSILGGIIATIIYLDDPTLILDAKNIYVAIQIGIISGASSTGTNQIIKQIFKKNTKEE